MFIFFRKHLPITLAYLALTLIFTYPLILHMTSGCVEPSLGGSNDQYLLMWDAWWVKKALFDLHCNPYFTCFINYPQGASLALSEIGLFNGILIAPFQFLLEKPHGLILGYNVMILLSFLVSAIGMYSLAFDISSSRSAAFIAGIGYAFMPYRTMYITTVNLLSTGWIPLYILFFLRTIRAPRPRNVIWAGVFFALTLHSSFMYAFFLLLSSFVLVFAHLLLDHERILNRQVLKGLLALFVLCFVIILPNLIIISLANIRWSQPIEFSEMFSANVIGYFLPSDQQILYRHLFSLLPAFEYYMSGVPGHATFISFTLLFLFIYGIIKTPRRDTFPWLVFFGIFFLLALGTKLHFWKWIIEIKLPYLLLRDYVPYFNALRTPFRFTVLERISLLIVAAYGMRALCFSRNPDPTNNPAQPQNAPSWFRKVLPGIISLVLVTEILHIPFRYVPADTPEIYQKISETRGNHPVVDLPVSRYRDVAKYMFYQTIHEKPIPIGIVNREEAALEGNTGGIVSVLRSTTRADYELFAKLRVYGAGYVILHTFRDNKDMVSVYDLRSDCFVPEP